MRVFFIYHKHLVGIDSSKLFETVDGRLLSPFNPWKLWRFGVCSWKFVKVAPARGSSLSSTSCNRKDRSEVKRFMGHV